AGQAHVRGPARGRARRAPLARDQRRLGLAHGGEPRELSPELARTEHAEARLDELGAEAVVVEAVRLRVIEDAAPEGVPYELREDFLGVEAAARLEHAAHLVQRLAPARDVVND